MHKIINIQPRLIISIGLTIALIIIVGGIFTAYESRDAIYRLLDEEAYSLAETIEHATINIILSSNEIEKQLSNRLLTIGYFVSQLDSAFSISRFQLKKIADENNIFCITILDRAGKYIKSNHSINQLLTQDTIKSIIKPILDGSTDFLILGTLRLKPENKEFFTVAIRRTAISGGAIILNSDISDLVELRKTIGIGKLVRDIGNNKGIEYIALQDQEGIIAASSSVTQLSSIVDDSILTLSWEMDSIITRETFFQNKKVYEILNPITVDKMRIGVLRIGLSLKEALEQEKQANQRIWLRSIILFFVTLLTTIALIVNQYYQLSHKRLKIIETFTGNILEQMYDAVITLDSQRNITIFNRKAEQMFSVKGEDIVGKNIQELDESLARCLLKIFSSSGKEIELNCPSNKQIIVSVSLTTTNKTDGTIESQTAVIRDLTETRKLEIDNRRKEKLSAMGKLASAIAHEIRNPLNAISMIAQRYEKEFKPQKGKREYHALTNVLKKESARVNEIIQQFLKFARPPKLNRVKTSIVEFTSYISTLFESQAKSKGIKFISTCNKDHEIMIDQSQMKQAILNILQNALDATKKGGTIFFKTFVLDNKVIFEITDTGIGIPSDKLEKIFDLYYTTKSDGTGVGLSITQQIVSQHGGTIEVKSEENKGTTFTVTIPI